MKWTVGSLVLLCLVLLPKNAQATPVTLFSDSFENGFVAPVVANGNWTTIASSAGARTGVDRASVAGPTAVGGDSLTVFLSTDGHKNVEFDFSTRVTNALEEASGDKIITQFTTDGGQNWSDLLTITGPTTAWTDHHFVLPPEANDNELFGVRWVALLGNSSDVGALEDIVITASVVPEPTSIFMAGTLTMMTLAGGSRRRK